MTRRILTRSLVASALAGALVPGTAGAASFYIIESSPARLGNAFAGTASEASDASTVYFNSAGMSRLEGSNVTVAGHYVMPEAEFDNNGSSTGVGTPSEGTLRGPDSSTDESALVPNVYYTQPLTERWTLGIGVNAPFGLSSSYDENWVGRYHATDSELTTVNFNPTLSYAFDDNLSFGFGISYQTIDATLEKEVDSYNACFEAATTVGGLSDAVADGNCSALHTGPGTRANDSSSEVTGDDSGWGLDFGVLYEFDKDTRIGASYRQGIDYTLKGEVEFDRSTSCANDTTFCSPATQDGDVEAGISLPDILTLSATHGITENWTISGDFAWYEWSVLDEVRIERESNGQEVSTLELDYNDTTRVAVGATYSDDGPWTWRGGLAMDESPISGKDTVTPRIPDGDRTWLSFGFNYAMSPDASIDFGYAHLIVEEVKIESTEQRNTLKGEFDPSVDILAVSGNWRF